MSLVIRRMVFYLLLLVFVIAAPTIIAYTAGYRYSFTQRRIVKTGALSLSTLPPDASITLNGTTFDKTTPALITERMPGNYIIELTREGYHTWKKTLLVESAKTTFANDIVLFKQQAPERSLLPLSSQLSTKKLLPQNAGQFAFFHDNKRDQIIIIDNKKQLRIGEINGTQAVWWEQEQPNLLIYSAHEISEFNPQMRTFTLLTRLFEKIQDVIPLPRRNALLLILAERVVAIERDQRDRQNRWDLASFDEIQTASLAEDSTTLIIDGTREGKSGVWELELQ